MPGKNGKEIDSKKFIFLFISNLSLGHFAGKGTRSPSVGLYYLHKKTAAL
jgi:hypothetical protein